VPPPPPPSGPKNQYAAPRVAKRLKGTGTRRQLMFLTPDMKFSSMDEINIYMHFNTRTYFLIRIYYK
jgi:hypothetical protein